MNKDDLLVVKQKLESIQCPYCKGFPSINVADNAVSYKSCCDEYKDELFELINREYANQKARQIDSIPY